MSHSPLRALVHQLRPVVEESPILGEWFYFQLFDAARATGAEAIAGCGHGLDHLAGERVLASILHRSESGSFDHRLAAAITDRRTVLSGWSSSKTGHNDKRFVMPHAQLVQVEKKESLLANHVALIGPGGRCELPFAYGLDQLAWLFHSIATQLPYEARVEPPTPFLLPSEADPSGATGAIQALWCQDPQAAHLLGAIDAQVRGGVVNAEAAQELAGRVVLAHRSRADGPGMHEGSWVSPLRAQDLGNVLTYIFGPPLCESHPMPGWCALDFAIDPARDVLGAAIDALGVAAYVGIGIGFSPIGVIADRMMARVPVTRLRVSFADAAGFSRYQLQAPPGLPLERVDALMAHRLHQALIGWSYRVLERTVATVPSAPPPAYALFSPA